MILLIGNKGRFLELVFEQFKSAFKLVNCFDVDSLNMIEKDKRYSCVVYIGGETRHENKMNLLNVQIAKKAFVIAQRLECRFVYLSSLSVFGWVQSDIITCDSKRNPLDLYGKSKLEFDEYINETGYPNVCSIYPASINSGRGRSSIEKITALYKKYSFLRLLKLRGSLSYINRDELMDCLVVNVSSKSRHVIMSKSFELQKLSSTIAIPIPKFSMSFLNVMFKFFPNKKTLNFRMLTRGLVYK